MPSVLSSASPAIDVRRGISSAAVDPILYPSVEGDELAFALTFFVASANQTLASGPTSLSSKSMKECERLHKFLYSGHTSPDWIPIQTAFRALWHHYEESAFRHSICARVFGFYLLMERTGAAYLGRWIEMCPNQPDAVLLHAEVVCALAAVELDADGVLIEKRFYDMLEKLAVQGQA